MWTSGWEGSSKSIGANEPSALRACMPATRWRRASVNSNVESRNSEGLKDAGLEHLSEPLAGDPFDHLAAPVDVAAVFPLVARIKQEEVISAFFELVMTLGCPFSCARRLYFSLKKS